MTPVVQLLVIIGLSAVGVVSDTLVKFATTHKFGMASTWFVVAVAIYVLLPFGWFPVLKHVKLSVVGVVYAVCTALLLTVCGVVIFHERLTVHEILGLLLGVASVVLLTRSA